MKSLIIIISVGFIVLSCNSNNADYEVSRINSAFYKLIPSGKDRFEVKAQASFKSYDSLKSEFYFKLMDTGDTLLAKLIIDLYSVVNFDSKTRELRVKSSLHDTIPLIDNYYKIQKLVDIHNLTIEGNIEQITPLINEPFILISDHKTKITNNADTMTVNTTNDTENVTYTFTPDNTIKSTCATVSGIINESYKINITDSIKTIRHYRIDSDRSDAHIKFYYNLDNESIILDSTYLDFDRGDIKGQVMVTYKDWQFD